MKIEKVMRAVDRSLFLPPELKSDAARDAALPIGKGQTISQPRVVKFMLEQLEVEKGDKVMEIGSGSGYVCALLSHLAAEVHGLEIDEDLVASARPRLESYKNVTLHCADGHSGLQSEAPFDRILASFEFFEPPVHLLSQLADMGRLVVPVKHTIQVYKKETHHSFVFVPNRSSHT